MVGFTQSAASGGLEKRQNKGAPVMSLLFQQRSNDGSRRLFGEVDSEKILRLSGLLAFLAVFSVVYPVTLSVGLGKEDLQEIW
jgi:hypothetical protein